MKVRRPGTTSAAFSRTTMGPIASRSACLRLLGSSTRSGVRVACLSTSRGRFPWPLSRRLAFTWSGVLRQ
eukprot:3879343-Heterocapsa_arctica.AAC.1